MEALATHPSELSTLEKIRRTYRTVFSLFEAGNPVCVAWSGGKDSTILASVVLSAARQYMQSGRQPPHILVTHANTGIENPAYQRVIDAERERMEAYIVRNRIPARIDLAEPTLNDSWAVSVLSGRVLPTFARSKHRQCSVMFKVQPQERQRKAALEELSERGDPVVLIGTRYDESSARADNMARRGESDTEIVAFELQDNGGKIRRTEYRLSPIAWWNDEDVWVFLDMLRKQKIDSYTDVKDIWEAYAAGGGGGTCAVVGDEGMKANAKACGARFGCALCTAVGRDKSLESMIESDPSYSYLTGLNRIQRYLVATQFDATKRNWLGRSIDDNGYISIAPDTYSPQMLRTLLAMCLSVQQDEAEAAAALGIPPRFTLVSDQQLIAIDAIWSLQGIQPEPFEALRIWDRIINAEERVYPEENQIATAERTAYAPFPGERFIHVDSWEDDPEGELNSTVGPLFDPIAFAAGVHEPADQAREIIRFDIERRRNAGESISLQEAARMMDVAAKEAGGCLGFRTLPNGSTIIDTPTASMFEIDKEAASLFLDFEAQRHLQDTPPNASPLTAIKTYMRLGMIATSGRHMSIIDQMARRTEWKVRHGLHHMDTEALLSISVSRAERTAGQNAPHGQLSLREQYLQSSKRQKLDRYRRILSRHEPCEPSA